MLKRIHIENFKSLKNVTLDLQPVNLLIGPNNSGKSNLLKALEFFDKYDAETQFHSKISNIIFKQKEEIFRIYLTFDAKNRGYITISQQNTGENGSIKHIHFEDSLDHPANPPKYWSDSTERKKNISKVIIYKPDPLKLAKPAPLLPNSEILNSDTSNLVAFIDSMRDNNNDVIKLIEKDLNICIPEFSEIRLSNVEIDKNDDLIKLYGDKTFKRLGLYNPQQKITYWADELSEGTLYFLALLCIIHQPNPPKLLLLEEPEKGIHPRRIKEVVDFIFNLAQEKDIQVIMTTHHPYVVNEFQDIPEAVFIFDKDEEGATQIKNLQKDIIEPSDKVNDAQGLPRIKFTQDLAEHWVLGFMGGVPK